MDCEGGAPPLPAAAAVSPPSDGGEDEVMSEVHLGCPPNYYGPHISRFTISLPPRNDHSANDTDTGAANVCDVDEDGDLVPTRRGKKSKDRLVISIKHNITSSIPKVGLQVWRAELVLADFVLHTMYTSSQFDQIVAVELGAGTGLVSLLLARAAKTVFITDHGDDVLDNCADNIHLNAGIFDSLKVSVYVKELDWNASWPPQVIENSPIPHRYGWRIQEVEELQQASVLVAADVIYNDDLTDALFRTLEILMYENPEKVLYLALEKRYNFSIDDLDVVANGYSRFCSYLTCEEDENDDPEQKSACAFVGNRINLDEIPQYVREYNRVNDVELWRIKYNKRKL